MRRLVSRLTRCADSHLNQRGGAEWFLNQRGGADWRLDQRGGSAVAVVVAFVLSAVPPATNVGPGVAGYLLVLVVLAAATLWALHERGRVALLSRGETWAVGGLFAWMALCLVRSGDRWDTALAATILAAIACLAAWALLRTLDAGSVTRTVTAMLGAAVVGSAVAAWVVPIVTGHAVLWRPGLPIGGASNNAVGLTLGFAAAVARVRMHAERRWWWRVISVMAALLIVQSLSRAGWLLALVVLVVMLVSHRRVNLRWGVPVGGLVAVVGVLELVRRRGADVLVDPARWDNAVTGVEAWSGSLGGIVFGIGPMRVWPWLALERGRPGEELVGMQHDSPWGQVLYHAHSTYLEALVEYGLVGLVLLLVVLGLVVRRCVREIRRRGELSLVAVALLLSLPAMLVELYLFRGFVTALLWWAAVLAVGRVGRRPLVR